MFPFMPPIPPPPFPFGGPGQSMMPPPNPFDQQQQHMGGPFGQQQEMGPFNQFSQQQQQFGLPQDQQMQGMMPPSSQWGNPMMGGGPGGMMGMNMQQYPGFGQGQQQPDQYANYPMMDQSGYLDSRMNMGMNMGRQFAPFQVGNRSQVRRRRRARRRRQARCSQGGSSW